MEKPFLGKISFDSSEVLGRGSEGTIVFKYVSMATPLVDLHVRVFYLSKEVLLIRGQWQ